MRIEDYSWPIKEGHTPYFHQKHTAQFAIMNPRCYILNDMGTGKTLSALWAADILLTAGKIDKVLVVCPLSTMISTWCKDIVFNLPHRKYITVHGSKDFRRRALNTKADFYIINHDGVKVMEDEIIAAKFKLVIIDELTAFKNFQSDRTKSMFRITRAAKGVWGMTGAPTPNSPLEAFGQAKVVNPFNSYLPPYYGQFKQATMITVNEYIEVPKPGAKEFVFKVLQPAIRYAREDCVDLPPVVYDVREVPLTIEQKTAYNIMAKELLVESETGSITAANAAVKISKMLQICAGSVIRDDGTIEEYPAQPRFEELWDIYLGTPQQKLIVFCANRASIHRVVQFFRGKEIHTEAIYGDVDQRERAQFISEFQGGQLRVLVIQPQAASHGITLTAANTIVWFSLLPSNEVHQQANHRIIRIGQTRGQMVIYLVGSPVERRRLKDLEVKQEFSAGTLESFKELIIE